MPAALTIGLLLRREESVETGKQGLEKGKTTGGKKDSKSTS